MKKRLRKKLHRGEFAEFGFHVIIHLAILDDEGDRFVFPFVDMIESIGLGCNGGGSNPLKYFITSRKGSAKEEDRERVRSWLTNQPSEIVTSFEVKELKNAWYS